ncbi:hypothetical protein J6590_015565 [Homalodisca vitripennis]|nr:hypothetical protein J6590_015565 [Homalodisca vitripennis]
MNTDKDVPPITSSIYMTVTDLDVFCCSNNAPDVTMVEATRICPKALRADKRIKQTGQIKQSWRNSENNIIMTVTDLAVFCYSNKAPVDAMMEVTRICPKASRADMRMDLTSNIK